MSRKTSSRSGRSTRSKRAEVQVPSTTPDVRPDAGAAAQSAPAIELHLAAPTPSSALGGESWHEQIARRAYELFLARAGAGGDPFQDWLRAERELQQLRAA